MYIKNKIEIDGWRDGGRETERIREGGREVDFKAGGLNFVRRLSE